MEPTVALNGVWHSYGDASDGWTLKGVDLQVAPGELLGLLGPSGCGKTTLLRLIAGFERPRRGTVQLDQRMVAGDGIWMEPERRGVGMVFQDYALFPHLNAWQNASFGLPRRNPNRERVAWLFALLGLKGLEQRYPHQLSGGQQQRVLLARALMQQTEILLLDEPCSAIDPPTREHLLKVLRDQAEAGQTLLVSSHDWGSALDSYDQVVVMDGQILANGSPDSVREKLSDLTCMMGSHCCG